MNDRYFLTQEQNIFLAKRNIVDYIYKSANLEGISVTYPDTQAIYDGINSSKYTIDEVVAINNLKHAWQFILDEIDIPLDYHYICHINELVGINLFYNAGKIRTVPVKIGGTNWQPNFPIESQIKEELETILNNNDKTLKAIKIMLYIMRKQMFIDGNKRVAMLVANKIMIENGCGIISIPIEFHSKFYELLIKYYETNNDGEITKFIYDNCIDGVSL